MIQATRGARPEDVNFNAKHVLFVEGDREDSFDVKVLEALFDPPITISPLGPSYSVKSVAQALHPYHPAYYFLIDRDPHHDDAYVERCWTNFPDPDTHNLLVWRRRELENYFLDPSYLLNSSFCRVSEAELTEKLVELVSRRLYLDTANWVLIDIRERQKRKWIEMFKESEDLATPEIALERLKSRSEFAERIANVEESVSAEELERIFAETLQKMTGDDVEIALGRGAWIEMIQGKKVFAQLVHSACFGVRTRDGTTLQGRAKSQEIVKDLLRKEPTIQPPDFVELRSLIQRRVRSG